MADPHLPPSRFTAGHSAGTTHSAPTPALAYGAAVTWAAAAPIAQPATTSFGPTVNRLAVAAFVMVLLLGPVLLPAAVPTALAGRRQAAATGAAGVGLANAALILSAVYCVLVMVVVALLLVLGAGATG